MAAGGRGASGPARGAAGGDGWPAASQSTPANCRRFKRLCRSPWTTRIWQEYRAGNLTCAARDVLLTLHTFRGTGGRCWPSHATLADRAKCCTRTVWRALQQAQHLGLLTWAERRIRAGWRWLRTSNLYKFMVPEEPATSSRAPYFLPSLRSSATESVSGRSAALAAMLKAAEDAPDLLAMRRAVMARVIV